ncbi:energy-coupling factor transporter transmembrane component T [Carnobacteriaceae bacterium 52-44]
MEISEKLREFISIEQLKVEVLNAAYGNTDTAIAQLDPRTIFIWYFFYALFPWFTHSPVILTGMFLMLVAMIYLAKVSYLLIFLFVLGLIGQGSLLVGVSLLFGGGIESFIPIMLFELKLAIISLAGLIAFSTMEPEKLSDGLLKIGVPGQISFAISYGYRMLPTLIEEYHHVFISFRLRGKAPEKHGFLYLNTIIYFMKIVVKSFYPLMLSSAKRARTTVESLESRGSLHSFNNAEVKKVKLQHLTFTFRDILFGLFNILYILTLGMLHFVVH